VVELAGSAKLICRVVALDIVQLLLIVAKKVMRNDQLSFGRRA
jgi:predicted hotdog family 3-hydroxylacyl-ACP dehydratase